MNTNLSQLNYQQQSALQWEGIRSNKFPKPRRMLPHNDIIKTGLDLPNQVSLTGRIHFQPKQTHQYQFKPILRHIDDTNRYHWHPRPSAKKVFEMSYTQAHQRREKSHFQDPIFLREPKAAGIRTFYNTSLKFDQRQYSVQNRMQRKARIDQLQLRQNAFKQDSLLTSNRFKNMVSKW